MLYKLISLSSSKHIVAFNIVEQPATLQMACETGGQWVRNPTPVTVGFKIIEEQVTIVTEGYANDAHQKEGEIVVDDDKHIIYGRLCVKKSGRVFVDQGPEEPDDASQNCK